MIDGTIVQTALGFFGAGVGIYTAIWAPIMLWRIHVVHKVRIDAIGTPDYDRLPEHEVMYQCLSIWTVRGWRRWLDTRPDADPLETVEWEFYIKLPKARWWCPWHSWTVWYEHEYRLDVSTIVDRRHCMRCGLTQRRRTTP